jgi:predicted transcriptional regulator
MKLPQFTIRGFKRPSEVVDIALGKLEREVMDIAWKQREVSVREVFLVFEKRIAYTTLMTTMHRLYKKGVLARRKQGRAFIYAPQLSHSEFKQGIARGLIDGLIGHADDGMQPLLACIVDAVSEHDRDSLDALDRLIQEKKLKLHQES